MATDTGIIAAVYEVIQGSPVKAILYLLLVITAYHATVEIARVIYNVFFHPLRNIPGPALAGASGLYKTAHLLTGRMIYHEQWLHKEYGPIVRVRPNEISFIDPQAWRDIYGHRTGGKPSTVKRGAIQPAHEGHDMLEFIASDEEHGQRRRLYAHAFSDRAIREQEPMLKQHVRELVDKLAIRSRQEPCQDIVQWLHFCTFDIMADLAFGDDLGMLKDGKYNPWVKAIVSSMKEFTIVYIAQRYQPFKFLFEYTYLGTLLKRSIDQHRAFAPERVDKRLDNKLDRPDIWGLVMKANEERLPSRWAMHEDGMLFMQAGTDTTATLLSGLLYWLLRNPDKLAKLQNEIRTRFDDSKDLELEQLTRLPYMAACIEEGLRIHPPAPPGFIRDAPVGGIAVSGRFFDEGTTLAVPQYAAYHSKYNFALPDEFHPERWTNPPDARFVNDKKDACQPFLYGPRNCIGKNLAYNEIRLILTNIILAFDLELEERSRNWMPHDAWGLWQKPPLYIKFTPRSY